MRVWRRTQRQGWGVEVRLDTSAPRCAWPRRSEVTPREGALESWHHRRGSQSCLLAQAVKGYWTGLEDLFSRILARGLQPLCRSAPDSLLVFMWPYWFIDRNFACSLPLPWSISAKYLAMLLRHVRSVAPKPLTCPSHLQLVHRSQAKSLGLLDLDT